MLIKKFSQFFIDEVKYNGHIQSFGAASIVYMASILLGIDDIFLSIIVIYLIFQQIYTYDRYRDIKKDYLTNRRRTAHLRSYLGYIPSIFILMMAASLILLFMYSSYKGVFLSIVILILGLLYPIYFKDITKYIYFFKNIYVASVFTILVLYANIFYSIKIQLDLFTIALLAYVFFESLFTQFFLDIKDYKKDRISGLLTLPSIIGKERAIKVLSFLNYAIFVSFTALYLIISVPDIFLILILGTSIFNHYTIFILKDRGKDVYSIVATKYILWTVIIMIVNILI